MVMSTTLCSISLSIFWITEKNWTLPHAGVTDVKKEDAKMKEDANFIQKNERSLKEVLKEVLNQKDYEKTLPIIEYLETNSAITTQTARQITGKSLATAWRYIQILVKKDVLEADGNTNNAEYVVKDIYR